MEQVTIGQIVGAISSLMVVLGFMKLIYEFVKQSILNRINKNEEEIKILRQEMEVKKAEARDSKEERLLLMNGVLACLKGLKEQGCNGPVTEGINQFETYLIQKSHD